MQHVEMGHDTTEGILPKKNQFCRNWPLMLPTCLGCPNHTVVLALRNVQPHWIAVVASCCHRNIRNWIQPGILLIFLIKFHKNSSPHCLLQNRMTLRYLSDHNFTCSSPKDNFCEESKASPCGHGVTSKVVMLRRLGWQHLSAPDRGNWGKNSKLLPCICVHFELSTSKPPKSYAFFLAWYLCVTPAPNLCQHKIFPQSLQDPESTINHSANLKKQTRLVEPASLHPLVSGRPGWHKTSCRKIGQIGACLGLQECMNTMSSWVPWNPLKYLSPRFLL